MMINFLMIEPLVRRQQLRARFLMPDFLYGPIMFTYVLLASDLMISDYK